MKLNHFSPLRQFRYGAVTYGYKLAGQGISFRWYGQMPGGKMWFFNITIDDNGDDDDVDKEQVIKIKGVILETIIANDKVYK